MRKKAKNLKRGDKILIPLESGIYCTKTPLCLAIAKLTNVTFSEKSAIINTREYKPFSLPLESFVKIEK
jgi:hypothetical protein